MRNLTILSIILAFMLTCGTVSAEVTCPEGWTPMGKQKKSCYRISLASSDTLDIRTKYPLMKDKNAIWRPREIKNNKALPIANDLHDSLLKIDGVGVVAMSMHSVAPTKYLLYSWDEVLPKIIRAFEGLEKKVKD